MYIIYIFMRLSYSHDYAYSVESDLLLRTFVEETQEADGHIFLVVSIKLYVYKYNIIQIALALDFVVFAMHFWGKWEVHFVS